MMDYSVLIGRKVISSGFRGFGEGVIVAIGNGKISIDFFGNVKDFSLESFFAGSVICHFECDKDTRALIQAAIEEITVEKAAAEAKRKADEEAKKAAAEAEAKRAEIIGAYGADYHAEHLETDKVYTYQQVEAKFGIRIAGFGRGCNPTDGSVVLISSVKPEDDNFVYHDKWDHGDYIFSGEGRIGDQTLTRGNLEIANAETNGKEIHLFVKKSAQEYYYQGIFKVINYTYEDDYDANGNIRQELKFRLRKV